MEENNSTSNNPLKPPPPDRDQTFWAMMCHISTLALYFFPIGNIIAPMILWHLKKDEHPFIDYHGKEALNFQISMTIYMIISIFLILLLIGFLLLIFLALFNLIVVIIAALKARDGQLYEYPMSIRFIK